MFSNSKFKMPTVPTQPAVPKWQNGISAIEILIVVAIITTGLTILLSLATFSLKASSLIKNTIQAKNIAEEILEAVRNYRDTISWNNDDPGNEYDGLGVVATAGAYHPEKSAGAPAKWRLLQNEQVLDGFTRKVVFDPVSRDGADNIESIYNAANNDPNTKKATATASWQEKGLSHQVVLVTYLTNWR